MADDARHQPISPGAPPATPKPVAVGHIHIQHWLPHLANVLAGRVRLSAAQPETDVLVHLLPWHHTDIGPASTFAGWLWLATAAKLPHVNPALAIVELDRQGAVLSAPCFRPPSTFFGRPFGCRLGRESDIVSL